MGDVNLIVILDFLKEWNFGEIRKMLIFRLSVIFNKVSTDEISVNPL